MHDNITIVVVDASSMHFIGSFPAKGMQMPLTKPLEHHIAHGVLYANFQREISSVKGWGVECLMESNYMLFIVVHVVN